MELISQKELELKYNLNSGEIDLEKLKKMEIDEEFIEYLNLKKDNNQRIKIGLRDNFALLQHLNNGLGKKYMSDKKIQNLMKKRNFSILAHGLNPIDKNIASEIYTCVEEYVKSYIGEKNLFLLA